MLDGNSNKNCKRAFFIGQSVKGFKNDKPLNVKDLQHKHLFCTTWKQPQRLDLTYSNLKACWGPDLNTTCWECRIESLELEMEPWRAPKKWISLQLYFLLLLHVGLLINWKEICQNVKNNWIAGDLYCLQFFVYFSHAFCFHILFYFYTQLKRVKIWPVVEYYIPIRASITFLE